jgi:hypothetical protein
LSKVALLLGCICCLSLSSCFELIEQLEFKKNGTGNLQVVLNMSRSRTRINSILKMKSINGRDVPSKAEISNRVTDLERTIAGIPGITQAKSTIDFENYIITLRCNFTQVQQLNSIAKKIREKENTPAPVGNEQVYAYNAAAKMFSRINKYFVKKDYEKLSNADKEVFATAEYTALYKFEQNVSSTTNKDSRISANKKAVMLKHPMLDIINNKKTIENNIILKD